MSAIYPVSLNIPTDHPRLSEFIKKIGAKSEPITVKPIERLLPFENCYWNVHSHTISEGGSIMFGWMLTEWPGIYLSAEHHAVWRSEDGEIFDVTARSPNIPDGTPTIFLPDDSFEIDFERTPNIRCVHLLLTKNERAAQHISTYHEKHRLAGMATDIYYSAGYRCKSDFLKRAMGQNIQPKINGLTRDQQRELETIVPKYQESMVRLGQLTESLIRNPPNKIARAAANSTIGKR